MTDDGAGDAPPTNTLKSESQSDNMFGWLTDGLSALVLFALMVMTCIDVFGRELLNTPLNGATELTQLMMGAIVFAVLPIVSFREEHITVDLLDKWFPRRFAPSRQVILNLAAGIMMAVVCWRVWIIGEFQMEYGDGTEFLRIPLGPVSYFISILSGITSVALFIKMYRHITGRAEIRSQDPRLNQ
ncbi:MAG: TRAP-type C4-dicarboxylate transport system permease small subunit [Paracoccaceae bacterium]|jgi:TRAP-type C4-dicarboxylate transport system permease small subunit